MNVGDQFYAAFAALSGLERNRRHRWVLSTATLDELHRGEDERRQSMASEFYKPEPLPEQLNVAEVQIFGWPIRIDDEATEPRLEVIS